MTHPYCILIHYHEISIKGDNRQWFEKIFARNVRKHIKDLPSTSVEVFAARVLIYGVDETRWDAYSDRLRQVMGLMNAHLVVRAPAELETIKSISAELIQHRTFENFRVSSRRQYKSFPLTSHQINMEVGAHLQPLCDKPVKLKGADLDVKIELVKGTAFIGVDKMRGFGGLPVGSGEKAISLISSGIDSPVSSFEMIKRGVSLSYVHFHSAPATNLQSIRNVKEILGVLAQYQLRCELYNIPLLDIQQTIMNNAPNKLWVILFRRAMVRLATDVANSIHAPALITGENVGQVASQTLSNIRATADATDLPILRPLAGMNKEDIVNRAKEISTYEISIEPYQDCCSFFVPIHPETKADLQTVQRIESNIDFGTQFEDAISHMEREMIVAKQLQKLTVEQ
jgi:thiamine biosynthesis protein ThiI